MDSSMTMFGLIALGIILAGLRGSLNSGNGHAAVQAVAVPPVLVSQ